MKTPYEECKEAIDVLLLRERKLIKELKQIQKEKIICAYILGGGKLEDIEGL